MEIEAKFVSKADFTALQNALNELIKRVDALKTDGLNAEQVKALIHAEIDALAQDDRSVNCQSGNAYG